MPTNDSKLDLARLANSKGASHTPGHTRDGQEIAGWLTPCGNFKGSVQVVRGAGDCLFYSYDGRPWIDRNPHITHEARL